MLASNELSAPPVVATHHAGTLLRKIESLMAAGAALLLLLLTFVTLIDVTGRGLLNAPLPGATEITELMLAGMSFLLYPIIARSEQHIVVDLIDPVSGPLMRRIQKLLSSAIGAGLFGVLAWRMWILAERAVNYGDATAALHVPTAPLYYGMSILSAVATLMFAIVLVSALKSSQQVSRSSDVTI